MVFKPGWNSQFLCYNFGQKSAYVWGRSGSLLFCTAERLKLLRKKVSVSMANTEKPTVVADDVVVSLDYTLKVNGEVLDTTEGSEPIQFLQGHQNIIPGLERELYGMKVGDTRTVLVKAAEGYGEYDPEAVIDVPRSEFPADIPLRVGVDLTVRNEEGELLDARITSVGKDVVQLDFNHPLAGKDLSFEVTVVDLRNAEPEELAHGHVHDEFDEEELEFEFDEEDFEEDDEEEPGKNN